MKSISLKASGRPQVPEILISVESVIARNRVSVSVISATVAYLGCLLDSEPTMFAGAFAVMLAIRHFAGEGGEK